jgi:hypothetical protein
MINAAVDTMAEFKAYSCRIQSLRSIISNYRGKYKKYATDLLMTTLNYTTMSELGTLSIYNVPSISERVEIINLALAELNIDVDAEIASMQSKHRMVVNINTDSLKLMKSVLAMEENLMNQFHVSVDTITCDSSKKEDAFLSGAIKWIKDNLDSHRQYLKAYTEARNLFAEHSKNGLFPRLYIYKGVVFVWEDVIEIGSYSSRVTSFLTLKDANIHEKYKLLIKQINSDRGEMRIMFRLDEFDYDEN